ncbi:hypothetical protein EGW08_017540, partial [Elysia chlorotica]
LRLERLQRGENRVQASLVSGLKPRLDDVDPALHVLREVLEVIHGGVDLLEARAAGRRVLAGHAGHAARAGEERVPLGRLEGPGRGLCVGARGRVQARVVHEGLEAGRAVQGLGAGLV